MPSNMLRGGVKAAASVDAVTVSQDTLNHRCTCHGTCQQMLSIRLPTATAAPLKSQCCFRKETTAQAAEAAQQHMRCATCRMHVPTWANVGISRHCGEGILAESVCATDDTCVNHQQGCSTETQVIRCSQCPYLGWPQQHQMGCITYSTCIQALT